MAFNIVRTGTAGVLGIASGVLATQPALTVTTGVAISPSAIAEGVGLALGAGLQFLSPMTLPNLADGLADGGLALLARRGAMHLVGEMTKATTFPGGYRAPYQMNGAYYGGVHSASAAGLARGQSLRGQVSSVGHLPEQRLS